MGVMIIITEGNITSATTIIALPIFLMAAMILVITITTDIIPTGMDIITMVIIAITITPIQ